MSQGAPPPAPILEAYEDIQLIRLGLQSPWTEAELDAMLECRVYDIVTAYEVQAEYEKAQQDTQLGHVGTG